MSKMRSKEAIDDPTKQQQQQQQRSWTHPLRRPSPPNHSRGKPALAARAISASPPSVVPPMVPSTPLSVLPEDDDAPVIEASPSTPPKKVWERSYRNFLKLKKTDHKGPPPPPLPRHQRSSSESTDVESSVRGGKLFAGVFRPESTCTPTSNLRKKKSLSTDALDATLRRGTEKSASVDDLDTPMRRGAEKAYSPSHSRYVAGARLAGAPALPPMDPRPIPRAVSCDDTLAAKTALEALRADSAHQHQVLVRPADELSSSSSAMKKAFTEFHNSSATGRDAVSAYLGDDPSHQNGHSLVWTVNHALQPSMRLASHADLLLPQSLSSAPQRMSVGQTTSNTAAKSLETVHEHVAIGNVRILKAVQSVDAWQPNRRYLIAPAALAASPLSVLTTLSGPTSLSAVQAAEQLDLCFGSIVLGRCLLASHGALEPQAIYQHWSDAVLVLRQNYLLEYAPDSGIKGVPRGYAHLQYAECELHGDFADTIELRFYGSPCARGDKRILMIRLEHREERDAWQACLNRAAKLTPEDLYEFDKDAPLGKGSYAQVFSARRKHHDAHRATPCALKIFDKSQYWKLVVKGRERADTLVREASVQATVTARCGRIPSFVRMRGFFETSENVVLEMELLEGTDLFKYISSKGVLKEPEAAHILRDVLNCLEAMNRIGLAHRDIKPANVLMCPGQHGPSCKVADFGMSTFVGVDGQLRGRCGTPGFVAPEIFTAGVHGGYGNKVDVFSAGVTLYVMLCGYEPFYGETDSQLVAANKEAKIDFPDDEWSGISWNARDLVSKMMEPNPKKRLDASRALKHPWFQTHLSDADTLDGSMSLPAAEVPLENACTIS